MTSNHNQRLALIVKLSRTIKCLMWVYIVSLHKGIVKVINGREGGKKNECRDVLLKIKGTNCAVAPQATAENLRWMHK